MTEYVVAVERVTIETVYIHVSAINVLQAGERGRVTAEDGSQPHNWECDRITYHATGIEEEKLP